MTPKVITFLGGPLAGRSQWWAGPVPALHLVEHAGVRYVYYVDGHVAALTGPGTVVPTTTTEGGNP